MLWVFFCLAAAPFHAASSQGDAMKKIMGSAQIPQAQKMKCPFRRCFGALKAAVVKERDCKCRHRRGCELLIANGDADHGASTVSHDADDDKEDAMMDRTALTELSANEPGYCFFSPEFGSTSPAAYDRDSLTCQDALSEPAYRKKHRSLEETLSAKTDSTNSAPTDTAKPKTVSGTSVSGKRPRRPARCPAPLARPGPNRFLSAVLLSKC